MQLYSHNIPIWNISALLHMHCHNLKHVSWCLLSCTCHITIWNTSALLHMPYHNLKHACSLAYVLSQFETCLLRPIKNVKFQQQQMRDVFTLFRIALDRAQWTAVDCPDAAKNWNYQWTSEHPQSVSPATDCWGSAPLPLGYPWSDTKTVHRHYKKVSK